MSLQWFGLKHLTGRCSAARSQPQLTDLHRCSFAGSKMCHCMSAGNCRAELFTLASVCGVHAHLNRSTHSAHRNQKKMTSPGGKVPLSFSQVSALLYLSLLPFSHISILSVFVARSPSDWANRWLTTQLCDLLHSLNNFFKHQPLRHFVRCHFWNPVWKWITRFFGIDWKDLICAPHSSGLTYLTGT